MIGRSRDARVLEINWVWCPLAMVVSVDGHGGRVDAGCPGMELIPWSRPATLSWRRVLAGVGSLTAGAITTWQFTITFHYIRCGISRVGDWQNDRDNSSGATANRSTDK